MTDEQKEQLTTMFGYMTTMMTLIVQMIARRRISRDDKQTMIYYAKLIVEKMECL